MTFGIEEIIHNSKKARRKCDKISNKKPKKRKKQKKKEKKKRKKTSRFTDATSKLFFKL